MKREQWVGKLEYKERVKIETFIEEGLSNGDIAKRLKRSKSTITREINRNKGGPHRRHYKADFSQKHSRTRRYSANKKNPKKDPRVWEYVEAKLKEKWTPEIISKCIEKDCPSLSVSHETIYQHIYQEWDRLGGYLPSKRFFRKLKKSNGGKKSKIPNRTSILERPDVINSRTEAGHWESDSIVSKKSKTSLNVMVERKTRYTQITKIPNLTSAVTQQAIISRLTMLSPSLRKSITYDNGCENHNHVQVNDVLGTQSYFCEPYHSWEKGSVEQVNMLIRRYIPKKTDLSLITDGQIKEIEIALNNRPRKCLGYQTPQEVFNNFV